MWLSIQEIDIQVVFINSVGLKVGHIQELALIKNWEKNVLQLQTVVIVGNLWKVIALATYFKFQYEFFWNTFLKAN